eukprot:5357973-Alexandrium_andersonii.AAC.1
MPVPVARRRRKATKGVMNATSAFVSNRKDRQRRSNTTYRATQQCAHSKSSEDMQRSKQKCRAKQTDARSSGSA